ncbi:Sulfite reductase [ferredoxin] [Pseudobythopirellula maris]|uniref:Sulfite reductase [ferredoxin] n=1 Tax=Pseudobythopirellula maris TaxID=2527991 RepID=A0A5C5ZQM3_9BACT|nr:NirA family protein [Pseudobythopirellula maris]TWT89769.1 Sulfite reductase [ferredoxin] [Pseudobythopirellula maris]
MSDSNESNGFSPEQQSYLQGFALGADVSRKVQGLPVVSGSGGPAGQTVTLGGAAPAGGAPTGPEAIHREAQDRQTAAGGKLVAEEKAKRDKDPLTMWDEMRDRAAAGEFPKKTDVFLTKYYGMFYVAPAQDSYMCRLRFPGGAINSWQLKGLADLADRCAGGYTDITTRANLQYREIPAKHPVNVLMGLRDLGVLNLGAGSDNIRNVTASPLSGLDPTELVETLPLAREMHHYILANREMYGLPRKFNIAFEGGGRIASLEDTNDIGFTAVEVEAGEGDDLSGVAFQLTLGGITGHRDFARPTGVVLKPEECVPVAAAIVRVFIKNGDRTDRNKARLKYVLDDWGFDKYIAEVEKEMGRELRRVPDGRLKPRVSDDRTAHIGPHPQAQPGLNYLGVVFPVGRMSSDQMRGLADIASRLGDGEIRLTVWQNLVIANLPDERLEEAKLLVEGLGLDWRASSVRAGLVACTGAAGCKYAASHTKQHAMLISDYVEERIELDHPVNIHVTGCHHSCAQHYIGDIGLIGAKVEEGEDMVEGYDLLVGGGYGVRRAIARELFPKLKADDCPAVVAGMLQAYLDHRASPEEGFAEFTSRHEIDQLKELFAAVSVA